MRAFVYNAQPGRVVFGAGTWAKVPDEVDRLGVRRVLITTSRGNRPRAEELAARLGARSAGVLDDARAHVPFEQAEDARATAAERRADGVVSVGGGTPIGLAKAIAHALDIPVIAVPTTYSGSEMTGLSGITRDGVKRVIAAPAMLPRTVIYDPELTYDLPAAATAATGMNAVAHCVEALYVPAANPVTSLIAEAGLAALVRGLPRAVAAPRGIEGRAEALYGACLAGMAVATAGIAIHHKLCHVLGGTYGLGHGEANAVVLPHAVAFNAPAAVGPIARVARAIGAAEPGLDDASAAARAAPFLFDFDTAIGAPTSLEALGLAHDALDEAARIALELITDNPRPVDEAAVRALLEDAWHGRRPAAA